MNNFKAIIAVDFDGTIVEVAYPDIGIIREKAVEYINKLYDEGYGIVINTCRSGEYEQNCINFLKENKIKYHHINENFPHLIELYNMDCRKISADCYIDDKCLMWNIPSWEEKYNIIKKKFEPELIESN